MDYEATLNIISRAWGRKLDDEYYCFFPWINREEQEETGSRRAGFHEGPEFVWPRDKRKIIEHMKAHTNDDLYWCPSLFEYPERKTENAVEEHCLWADLDEKDPRTIDDYPPTVAWETSPGRYQALWILNQGDILGASWEGGENQRLTYHVEADESGWDTTQLLRVPGWRNHKPGYIKQYGEAPLGRLLWKNKRFYLPDDFADLPVLEGSLGSPITDAIVGQIEHINVAEVKARIRLELTRRTREMLDAKEATGDRSSALWDLERSLADVGCSIEEIVALVRGTVWNKYADRSDELKRLVIEATKAVSRKSEKLDRNEVMREEADAAIPQRLDLLLANIRPPKWLVQEILTKGGLGFIAGEPKSFKSWFGLDLALSVASGARFLNHFDILDPGPVLYLQEEDSPPTVKSRYEKIAKDKRMPQVHLGAIEDGKQTVEFHPPQSVPTDAPINALLQGGLVLSDGVWQEWLDETLTKGYTVASGITTGYQLVIIDTLMMVAGDVEENRAQDMTTKFFKPLKQVARKHEVALILIHHMRKSQEGSQRGGQRMLGSVANHAWSEDAMYLKLGNTGMLNLETESKSAESRSYIIGGVGSGKGWQPTVSSRAQVLDLNKAPDAAGKKAPGEQITAAQRNRELINTLRVLGGTSTVKALTEATTLSDRSVRRGLDYLQRTGKVSREGSRNWYLIK